MSQPSSNLFFNRAGGYRFTAWLILLGAAFLRLFNLRGVPPGLSQDEVLNADIAEGILQGRHAIFFREGFGHEPLYHYLAALFQPLLGDNVFSIRLPSVFLSLLLIALSMAWMRRTTGRYAALVTGAILAVVWWSIIFGRIGLRPILEPLFLVLMALHWQRRPWLSGLFLGLAFYAYTPALVFFALPVIIGLHGWLILQDGAALRRSAIVLAIAALIYLPLFLTLRADPTLLERGSQLTGPIDALREGDWRPLWQNILRTIGSFGLVGDPRSTYQLPDIPILPLLGLFFYVPLLWALYQFKQRHTFFLLAWLFVGILPSILTPDAPSTIRMIGALPPMAMLVGAFLNWLVFRPKTRFPMLLPQANSPMIAIFIIMTVLLLIGPINFGFSQWANSDEVRAEKYQSVYFEMANYLHEQPENVAVVMDARFDPIDADSLRRNLGEDRQSRWVAGGNAVVIPNEKDGLLLIPEFMPLHPDLMAVMGLDSAEPLYRSTTFPSFSANTITNSPNLPNLPESIRFGDNLILLSYELTADQSALVTYWWVDGALPADLAIFTHVAPGSDQPPATQHDGLDVAVTTLQPADRFVQRHPITTPPDTSRPYVINIGVYTRTDAQRLTYGTAGNNLLTLPFELTFD